MKKYLFVCTFFCLCSTANAIPVSFFSNELFVDQPNEGLALQNAVTTIGHTVTPFTDFSEAGFSSALTSADVLVIPELELDDLFSAMSIGARSKVSSFVSGGGGIVIAGSSSNTIPFLNGIFGFSLVDGIFANSGSTTRQPGAIGTPFADDPATLINPDGTNFVSGLPAGALNIYSSALDGTSVFATDFGAGRVVYLGYDWFGTPPDSWNTVLDSAIQYTTAPVPVPAAIWLFSAGIIGLLGMRKKKNLLSDQSSRTL